jgi:hypothetical protein
MTTHLSAEQVRWWLDETALQDVSEYSEEDTEFNLQVTLSRLPIHLIKESKQGPIRAVGQSAFDTERARKLLREEESRTELLGQIGPILVSVPGFYTFLDGEGQSCQLRDAETLQMEHRIYPDEASQQALMDSLMGIATGMRYVQNVVAATHPDVPRDVAASEDGDS